MEIKILKNASKINGTYLSNGIVLEKTENESEFSGINNIHFYLHNIDDDSVEEILPNIDKYNIGEIVNASLCNEYLYFINLFKNGETEGTIAIIRYHIPTQTTESLYSYNDSIEEYLKTKRLKLFIINDLYLILQTEYLTLNIQKTFAGYFKFSQKLFNLKDEKEYDITDDKFNKNGIADIIALSENQCVMKTGFSLLENNIYTELEQEEASLESVSFVNIGQMISDLIILQDTITVETIEQAFYTKTIPYIKKDGNYLIYSCVDNELKEEEIKFYNLETAEVKSCINQDVIRYSDLASPYVLNGEPYICIIKEEEVSFLNLITGKVEVRFDDGRQLGNVFRDAVLFSGTTKKRFLKKCKPNIVLYSFPGKNILFDEVGEYVDSLITEQETIYIFEK